MHWVHKVVLTLHWVPFDMSFNVSQSSFLSSWQHFICCTQLCVTCESHRRGISVVVILQGSDTHHTVLTVLHFSSESREACQHAYLHALNITSEILTQTLCLHYAVELCDGGSTLLETCRTWFIGYWMFCEGNISAGVELSNLNMIVRILLSHSTDSIPILLLFWWPWLNLSCFHLLPTLSALFSQHHLIWFSVCHSFMGFYLSTACL